jgi:hypothetical protein
MSIGTFLSLLASASNQGYLSPHCASKAEVTAMPRTSGLMLAGLLLGILWFGRSESSSAQRGPAQDAPKLERMPRDLEIQFALSALPLHLRADASVYVLDPAKGYESARKGTNGFECIVERTEWERADFRDDVYAAMCYDAEGSRKALPVWMDAAKLRAEGKLNAEELKQEITRRFKNGTYRVPARSGVSYMIAPLMRTYHSTSFEDKDVMTMNGPHYMFYAPHVKDSDIGGKFNSPYPFMLSTGGQDYIILLVGDAERETINRESEELLKKLCAYRSFLCSPVRPHP